MTTTHLKKHLQTLSKEELIKILIELNKKFKPVEEYHRLMFTKDFESLIEKYKDQISDEFYPSRGLPKMRLSVARKAISEAKKIGLPADALADLMLFYVETGIEFTNDFGDIDEPFYNSMESMYMSALKHLEKENILLQFKDRAQTIVNNTSEIGWGFHDTLGDLYYGYYPN